MLEKTLWRFVRERLPSAAGGALPLLLEEEKGTTLGGEPAEEADLAFVWVLYRRAGTSSIISGWVQKRRIILFNFAVVNILNLVVLKYRLLSVSPRRTSRRGAL